MEVVSTIDRIKPILKEIKAAGNKVGFVATMGFLHEGHLSLVRESIRTMDYTVASVFVNPAQFAPNEDLAEYPRDIERDLALLEKEGVNLVFSPSVEEMYPEDYKTYVEVHDLQSRLCGVSRPIFFRGVCTIVLKLLHIVNPDVAFFGQKDAQQAIILKKMVQDLNMDVLIAVTPIVREPDGLAMSSRNTYLDEHQRQAALCLYRSLEKARSLVDKSEQSALKIREAIRAEIFAEPKAEIDYVEIVNTRNLLPVNVVERGTLIALAVFIDKIRLIDNIIV